jgi:hypothetical protein
MSKNISRVIALTKTAEFEIIAFISSGLSLSLILIAMIQI